MDIAINPELKDLDPKTSMYDLLKQHANKHVSLTAYDFFGTRTTYAGLIAEIDIFSRSLRKLGIQTGDSVLVSLPTCPQALVAIYALNRIGAVANIIHPLSSPSEIEFCLKKGRSRQVITLDLFFSRFEPWLKTERISTLILARLQDYLTTWKSAAFSIRTFNKIPKIKEDSRIIRWKDVMSAGAERELSPPQKESPSAVILYTGGTDGHPKGVLLSNYCLNFLSLALLQHMSSFQYAPGDKVLATLPVFHGFGLAVVVHTTLLGGGNCLLVPRFKARQTVRLLKKEKPNFLAGVPTFYEALLRAKKISSVDFSSLKGAFAGGDTVSPGLNKRFNDLLQQQGSRSRLLQGYGLTEAVSACSFMPQEDTRLGSAGLPLPGIAIKIVAPTTFKELPPGQKGEICISGPTLMLGYLEDEGATTEALKSHSDGKLWLHSGDMGRMDRDGFLFFDHRLRRIIKSSGMVVIPHQVENILNSHPGVSASCVVGIPDDYRMQRVKAFVVPKEKKQDVHQLKKELRELCKKNLSKWSIPKEIEIRNELPITKYGKVDYREMEREYSLNTE